MTSDLHVRTAERLRAWGVRDEQRIVCAVSGGADSSALAVVLRDLRRHRLELVWVRHALQSADAQAAEEAAVRALADACETVLHCLDLGDGAVEREQARAGCGMEAAARRLRYAAIAELIRSLPRGESIDLVTAHHLRDQAETLLMRAAGGHSAVEALAIPAVRPLRVGNEGPLAGVRVLRPFLDEDPEQFRSLLRLRGITWHEDPGNRSGSDRRSRVRSGVLPPLRDIIPGAEQALARFARSHEEVRAALEWFVDRAAQALDSGPDFVRVPRQTLVALPSAAREMLLRRAAYRLAGSNRLDGAALQAVLRALEQGTASAEHRLQDAGLDLRLDASELCIRARVVRSVKSGYLFAVEPDTLVLYDEDGDIWRPASDNRNASAGGTLTGVRFPAMLRDVRDGDRLRVGQRARAVREIGDAGAVIEDVAGPAAFLLRDGSVACRDGCVFTPAPAGIRNMIRLIRGQ